MCGICGKISFGKKKISLKELKEMANTLVHRGPDGEGFYVSKDRNVGLGHRRLSIIDLSTGSQPMANEDRTIWIVFNGEIYNFEELKGDLLKKGHLFKSKSDTEVIIHAYEEYQEECVKFLNGMFAFAIWDEGSQELFLARDRLGEKPLFYAETENSFIFASEVKAILANKEVNKKINFEALNIYLATGYILAPFSIIEGINKLPAATTLTFKNGKMKIKEYWDFDPTKKENFSEENWIKKFNDLFGDCVKKRLIADVPLGAFLSGGIDSTSVVAFMNNKNCLKTKTFSIGFKESSYNELCFSNLAAKFLRTDHQTLTIRPNIRKTINKIIWANDEPLGDTSSVPMWFLSEMTRKKVTVALSGDGGDENFAGYETYIADKIFPICSRLPFQSFFSLIIQRVLPTSFKKVSFDYKLKQFVKALNFTPEKAHYFWREIFSEEERKKLFKPEVFSKIKNHDAFFYFKKYFDKFKKGEFLDRSLYVDIKTWLVDDILVKVDRTSMGNSLETRTPFLDYRLIELLSKVPARLKLNKFNGKYLLKKAVSGIIPKSIIFRPKAGFNAPVPEWLRGELKSLLLEELSPSSINNLGFFNSKFVSTLIDDYLSGKKDNSLKLWVLLNFDMWHKMFIS